MSDLTEPEYIEAYRKIIEEIRAGHHLIQACYSVVTKAEKRFSEDEKDRYLRRGAYAVSDGITLLVQAIERWTLAADLADKAHGIPPSDHSRDLYGHRYKLIKREGEIERDT